MKRFAIFALAALAFAACQKEVEVSIENQPVKKTHTVTITAGFDAETKTAYDAQGKFSWVEGDQIGVLVTDGTDTKQVVFTTAETGPIVDFTGEVEDGFELVGSASYPFTKTFVGYACNDFAYNVEGENVGWRLWGSVKPDIENPLASTPLYAEADEDGNYQFKTVTGILKFTVENVPVETYYAYLEVPSDSDANLNGWYDIDPVNGLLMSKSVSVTPWKNRYNWNVPTGPNTTMDYYYFIPVGTLPVGTKFELCNDKWGAIQSFVFKQEVEIKRNVITQIAPVFIEPVAIYSLEDVLGTYNMEVTSSWIGGSTQTGDFVLEASDDPEKGNIMITKFAGIEGREYGTFDGRQLVFPSDQLFCENPFDSAEDYPYLALDSFWYGTGVVDAVFDIVSKGRLEYYHNGDYDGAYDAIGFRQTTEEMWFNDSHNGGWPWVISYGSLVLTTDDYVPELEENQIWLKPGQLKVNSDCSRYDGTDVYDGAGYASLVDGNVQTFWHSAWKNAEGYYDPSVDFDSTYGITIDIALEEALKDFRISYYTRHNNPNGEPRALIFAGSNDGESWTIIGGIADDDLMRVAAGSRVDVPAAHAKEAYKYLRIGIAKAGSGDEPSDLRLGGGFTSLAEVLLFKADEASGDGGSSIPDYDPVTGFQW